MNLREAVNLVIVDVQQLYPDVTVTKREAAEHVREHMKPEDIRFLIDDPRTREAYFVVLSAPSVDLNKELSND